MTKRRKEVSPAEFLFSAKTFAYFDAAQRKRHDRAWFDAHRARYDEFVDVPFTHLILELKRAFEPLLPGVVFSPRKLSRPVKRGKNGGPPTIRANAYAGFGEASESMFDTNPSFYIDLGAERSLIAVGLYEVSSRQMRELRPRLVADSSEVKTLLADRALRKHWKQPDGSMLAGDRYTRFPRDWDERGPGAEFLWHKQWMLARELTRDEVMSPAFVARTVAAFGSALPWLAWTRRAVGVWKRPKVSERPHEWL